MSDGLLQEAAARGTSRANSFMQERQECAQLQQCRQEAVALHVGWPPRENWLFKIDMASHKEKTRETWISWTRRLLLSAGSQGAAPPVGSL